VRRNFVVVPSRIFDKLGCAAGKNVFGTLVHVILCRSYFGISDVEPSDYDITDLQTLLQIKLFLHAYRFWQQRRSWGADSRSTSQEIHSLLWNQKFHYSFHKCRPLTPILSRINPIPHRQHPIYLRSILILSSNRNIWCGRKSMQSQSNTLSFLKLA
jgi:hypothetical protein